MKPLGLIALASLIPFIILYLRRPKPKDQMIPSLMFIMKDDRRSKRYAFFRKLANNLLFLIQLLALLGLSVSIAAPFVKLPYDVTLENTIIIVDVSASMSTKEDGVSRFDNAIKEAKGALSGRNTLILAENTPLIALEDEPTEIALDVISKIKPKATTTNIGDALLLAKDVLGDKPGRIVVLSDFSSTEGPDVQVVRSAISSKDRIIDFIDLSNKAQNVGIINLEVGKYTTKLFIKNYNSEEKTVRLKISRDGKDITSSDPIKISPKSIESFVFDTVEGVAKVQLSPEDGLATDNFAYIATPASLKNNVLLITNQKNSNLELALESARDVKLNVVNPPVLTVNTKKEKVEPFRHDVIIIYKINSVNKKEGILPGTFNDIREYVEKGGSLIIAAQEDLNQIDMEELEPARLKSIVHETASVCVDSSNELTKIFKIDECFTTTSTYFDAELKKDALSLGVYAINRKSKDARKNPVIVIQQVKKGNVAYYGIFDEASDFKTLPSYPILWNSLISFVTGSEDIKDFNFKSGKIAIINEQKVTTPSSSYTTSKLLMDEAGV
ncbi:BatA domain-containing protein, partial [Candidatus Woesearchaeota archaeon]|nr:BatA domain-containing protein [Candidatus Woesearchaeota archaeon]